MCYHNCNILVIEHLQQHVPFYLVSRCFYKLSVPAAQLMCIVRCSCDTYINTTQMWYKHRLTSEFSQVRCGAASSLAKYCCGTRQCHSTLCRGLQKAAKLQAADDVAASYATEFHGCVEQTFLIRRHCLDCPTKLY